MSTGTVSQSVGKSPCGCGCSGTSSSAPCTCGGASCTTCMSPTFIRPEFFAGQLLTEDDLQSLVNYVSAKNRLHARYLFGSGVVCGLKVKREPCKCGRVVVEPGYALDCCGNDIAVSCPQTLDVNQMINALMMKLRGGYDCGDPCAKQEAADASTTPAPQGSSTPPKGPSRRYCLYVNYCEQDTDPVTPYATTTPCGQPACQTTRVSEGFTFELRCPTKNCTATPAICQALTDCEGECEVVDDIVTQANLLGRIAPPIASAARRILDGTLPEPQEASLAHASHELELWEAGVDADLDRLRELMRLARRAATDLARFPAHKVARNAAPDASAYLKAAADTLSDARAKFTTALERAYCGALVEVIRELTDQEDRARSSASRAGGLGIELRFLQWGAVMTRDLLQHSVASIREVQEWLLDRRQQTGLPDDPIIEWEPRNAPPVNDWDVRMIERFAIRAAAVAEQTRKFIQECRCNALLPPCSTCTDTGVLLACLTVQDCCVTEICNLDRTFVLTGPNLRYWFPEIQSLGCEIEKCCCPSYGCEQPSDDRESSQSDFCERFFQLMLAPCNDKRYSQETHASRLHRLFSPAFEPADTHHAKRSAGGSLDQGFSSAFDGIRQEIDGLKDENAKLRERLSRAEKKLKAEK
jgi:hypothetical protein